MTEPLADENAGLPHHRMQQLEFTIVKRTTKENLFKPSRTGTKADKTDNAVRAIIEAEAAKRREKFERLRTKRLVSVPSNG